MVTWLLNRFTSVSELREEVAKLKRMVEERDFDWIEMRARCKRLLDRTEKAAKIHPIEAPTEEDAPSSEASNGRILSPRQRAVQQQILKRRAGL